MKTARELADAIWGTSELEDLSDFKISLSSAISMMEQYVSQDKWISVEERLPDHEQKVIGVNARGDVSVGYWNNEVGDIELSGSFWLFVTHWKPLPEPPKR